MFNAATKEENLVRIGGNMTLSSIIKSVDGKVCKGHTQTLHDHASLFFLLKTILTRISWVFFMFSHF
jgi:hypothetical protein